MYAVAVLHRGMGKVYQGLGGLSPPWSPDSGKIFVSNCK